MHSSFAQPCYCHSTSCAPSQPQLIAFIIDVRAHSRSARAQPLRATCLAIQTWQTPHIIYRNTGKHVFGFTACIDCAGSAYFSLLASFKVKIATLLRTEEVVRGVGACDLVNWPRMLACCFCVSFGGLSDRAYFKLW